MENRLNGMGEQSHLEAMREAVKGDLERARSRRPSIFERAAPPPFEIRQEPPPVEEEPEPVVAAEPEPEPVAEPELEPAAEPTPRRRFRLWRR